jgi:hypothetical protein
MGCGKTNYIDNKPKLKIQVLDLEDELVENAIVSLYNSKIDWTNKTNTIAQLPTNENGIVLFEELDEKQYFFFVEKESLTNIFDIYTHETPLEINVISQMKIVIK